MNGHGDERKRNHRSHTQSAARWLRSLCLFAPAFAQLVMFTALLLQRQWLFALLVFSSCVATLAALPASVQNLRRRHVDDADGISAEPHSVENMHSEETTGSIRAIRQMDSSALLGLNADTAPMRTICHQWCTSAHSTRLRATIGIDANHEPFSLDLVNHGPHAIVAGTTGSGKSVLLQSWCLALACRYSPRRLQFVFLDFKGGSALERLTELPHVRGCVNDLDLDYAMRALRALELELASREKLAAQHRVSDIRQMSTPPARLVIVVDEFHMLSDQLPDYIDRLVRVASLGRSLGMHLIVCTQNPMVQVNASMKSNMSLRLCLRVQDAMQSREMIDSADASRIPASCPGMAFAACDGSNQLFRCASPVLLDMLVDQIRCAARFFGDAQLPPLFTAPLPHHVAERDCSQIVGGEIVTHDARHVPIGIADNGVFYQPATIDVSAGNVAIIAQHHRGGSTLLRYLERKLRELGIAAQCFDDADDLLDPLEIANPGNALHRSLHDDSHLTVFRIRTTRFLRVPEHAATRVIFPTGERTTDLADGIPTDLYANGNVDELTCAGRAVLLSRGSATLLQCFEM